MNEVEILIISNKLDFTTDYICLELEKRRVNYLRINRDCFKNYEIVLDANKFDMTIKINSKTYYICENTLNAIYYRAPIYLRDNYKPNLSKETQLYRSQWMAFIRNLTIFENVIWVNNPVDTFRAENKLLQLKYAQKIGFNIPNTKVVNINKLSIEKSQNYIVKSLDTALLRNGEKESFVYSNKIIGNEILNSNLKISPVVIQEYLYPKIDIRVTVIGSKVYPAKILQDDCGIDGDWRKQKNNVKFVKFELPSDIKNKCIDITKLLGLSFGGIDLINSNGKYYFIEINPTGEWAWLVDNANLEIDKGICDYLLGDSYNAKK